MKEKIGNKKELYDFLIQECHAFLPKITCTNVYFLKSIINGEKEYLKRNEIILSAVPQIEGLSAEDFMNYAKNSPSIMKYFPDQCDWLHLDKRWICDVLMTLDKNGISQMIQSAKQKRREKLDQSQNLIIQMRPEFAQALKNSMNFSAFIVHKGRSAYLMKPNSQRKRRNKELEEVKIEECALRNSKQKYLEDNKRIKEDFCLMKNQIDELQEYKNLVLQLHEAGVINSEGELINQRQRLSSQQQLI